MTARIIDGKTIAAQVTGEIAMHVAALARNYSLQPGLAVVLVGTDPASQSYVGSKAKKCQELGIYSEKHELPETTTMPELLALIDRLNRDPRINGILVQSPPPKHLDEREIIAAIRPEKDVDCFHPVNVGKMLIGDTDGFYPCTPYGVMKMLEYSGIDPAGKHAVIIGRSNIVGKPMLALLMQKGKGADATVTVVHSRTPDLAGHTRRADILIAAIGKPEFVRADMVKDGAVVIDVGINRVADAAAAKGYRIVGDVAFDEVAARASFITPVPGGVGLMTVAMLMLNTVKACRLQNGIS